MSAKSEALFQFLNTDLASFEAELTDAATDDLLTIQTHGDLKRPALDLTYDNTNDFFEKIIASPACSVEVLAQENNSGKTVLNQAVGGLVAHQNKNLVAHHRKRFDQILGHNQFALEAFIKNGTIPALKQAALGNKIDVLDALIEKANTTSEKLAVRKTLLEALTTGYAKGYIATNMIRPDTITKITSHFLKLGGKPQELGAHFKSSVTSDQKQSKLNVTASQNTLKQDILKEEVLTLQAIFKSPELKTDDIKTHFLPIAKELRDPELIKTVNRFSGGASYGSFFTNATDSNLNKDQQLLQDAKALLDDYTKRGTAVCIILAKFWETAASMAATIGRIVAGNWSRNYVQEVHDLSTKIAKNQITNTQMLAKELGELRDTISKKEDYNEAGSCTRRIEYILKEIEQSKPKETVQVESPSSTAASPPHQ